jgi:probable rRNA maturation factor
MINLQVKRPVKLSVEKEPLIQAARVTLDQENASGNDLSLVFGNDTLLRKLNRRYRNIDDTTDVLSFPEHELDPDTQSVYLGDVVISLARAEIQAEAAGHPLIDELQLLVVHGTLHLLGYDHQEQADKNKMQAVQDDILQQLGVSLVSTL